MTNENRKRPSFQFYPSDWLADPNVIAMTATQRGGYIQLLATMWTTAECELWNDDAYLSKISGLTDIELGLVKRCFVKSPIQAENITHKRLIYERHKQDNFKDNCSRAGKQGGGNPAFKKGKPNPYYSALVAGKDKHKGMDKGEDKGNINSSSPSSSPSSKSLKKEIHLGVYEYWNSKEIIKHKQFTDGMDKAIGKALKTYTDTDLKTAIDKYALVLSSDLYFWTHKWTLEDFLKRGLTRFVDSPIESFLKIKDDNGQPKHEIWKQEGYYDD